MVRGLYTAGVGMTAIQNKFDVISNNIANMDTTGYKKDNVITQSFSEELMKRLDDPSLNQITHDVQVGRMRLGVFVDTLHVDYNAGNLEVTNNEFDLAVTGDGFFVVEVPDSEGNITECYTRDGGFSVMDGYLVTRTGYRVLGENGPILIQQGMFTAATNGDLFIDEERIGALRMVSFEDNQTLRKYRDNFFVATDESVIVPFRGYVQQGALEMSNVNPIREMVDMINVNRLYESNQRVISVIDQTLNRSVNDIARRN